MADIKTETEFINKIAANIEYMSRDRRLYCQFIAFPNGSVRITLSDYKGFLYTEEITALEIKQCISIQNTNAELIARHVIAKAEKAFKQYGCDQEACHVTGSFVKPKQDFGIGLIGAGGSANGNWMTTNAYRELMDSQIITNSIHTLSKQEQKAALERVAQWTQKLEQLPRADDSAIKDTGSVEGKEDPMSAIRSICK